MNIKEYTDKQLSPDSPIPCNLKVGDFVTFTNEYGVSFENHKVIGFRKSIDPDFMPDRFVHLDTDAYWFPKKDSEVKKVNQGVIIP